MAKGEILMGIGAMFDVADKLLGRFLPKKSEALRNKIKKLQRERDEIIHEPQAAKSTKRLTVVLKRLRDAEEALKNAA